MAILDVPQRERKASMGWVAANNRARCGTCRHADDPSNPAATWRCGLGDFATGPGAICRQYEPKAEDGAARQTGRTAGLHGDSRPQGAGQDSPARQTGRIAGLHGDSRPQGAGQDSPA